MSQVCGGFGDPSWRKRLCRSLDQDLPGVCVAVLWGCRLMLPHVCASLDCPNVSSCCLGRHPSLQPVGRPVEGLPAGQYRSPEPMELWKRQGLQALSLG